MGISAYNGDGRVTFGANLSPNHQTLAISVLDFTNQLWDVEDGRKLTSFDLTYDISNDIVFSHDSSRIFAAGGFGEFTFMESRSELLFRTILLFR